MEAAHREWELPRPEDVLHRDTAVRKNPSY